MVNKSPKTITKFKRFWGFTIAEVLIVLGIIGIIAELTIPSLAQKFQDKVTVVSLKKEISVLQEALNLARAEEGPIQDWYKYSSEPDDAAARINFLASFNAVLSKYLKVTKNCGTGTGCLPAYKYLNGNPAPDYETSTSYSKMQLADGSILFFSTGIAEFGVPDYKACGVYIYLDTNGLKGPNRLGYDTFQTYVYTYLYSPVGIVFTSGPLTGNLAGTARGGGICKASTSLGVSCTSWVIYRENRDYLYCDDLNWETKSTCN